MGQEQPHHEHPQDLSVKLWGVSILEDPPHRSKEGTLTPSSTLQSPKCFPNPSQQQEHSQAHWDTTRPFQ